MANLSKVYREKVTRLHEAFGGTDGTEALEIVRGLIEKVVLTPVENGNGLEIELVGEIAAMVALKEGLPLARGDRGLFASSVKVVAGTGFEPVTFRL